LGTHRPAPAEPARPGRRTQDEGVMKKPTRRQIVLVAIATLVLAVIVVALLPDPLPVDTAAVVRDSLRVTVEEEGRTAVVERNAGAGPWRLEPPRPAILAPRNRAQADAALRAAGAAVEEAAIVAERARADLRRYETLFEAGAIAERDIEQARAEVVRAEAALTA